VSDEGHLQLARADKALVAAKLLYEAGLADDAVSRAYYAMFHGASALLESKRIDVSSHRGVMSAVGQEWVRTGRMDRALIRKLQDAFRRRQDADYAALSDLDEEDARELIAWAEEFLQAVRDLLG